MYNCCHHIYWLTRTHGLGYLRVDTSSHQFLQAGDAFLRSRSLLVLVHTTTIIIISLSRLAFLVPTLTIRIRKKISPGQSTFSSLFHAIIVDQKLISLDNALNILTYSCSKEALLTLPSYLPQRRNWTRASFG